MRLSRYPTIPACPWLLHRLEAYATRCDAWPAPSSPHADGGCTGWKPMLLDAMPGLPRHPRMSLAAAQAGSLCYWMRCLACPVIPACRRRLHRLVAYATGCAAWTTPSSPHADGGCTGWKPMLLDAMRGLPRHPGAPLAVAQAGSLCYWMRCLGYLVIAARRRRLHRLEAYATRCRGYPVIPACRRRGPATGPRTAVCSPSSGTRRTPPPGEARSSPSPSACARESRLSPSLPHMASSPQASC